MSRRRRARERASPRARSASPSRSCQSASSAQRVVPERVDLDGLAAPRRHDPVAHLRVHPGQRELLGALPQQAVRRIDADVEARAGQRDGAIESSSFGSSSCTVAQSPLTSR